MKKRLLIVLFLVSIIVVFLCLYVSGVFPKKKKVYSREELERIMREELYQTYLDHKDEKDHWIHYISAYHGYDPDNCIIVIMLEKNREHLPEVKKHLKGYPIEYRFTDEIIVEEQSDGEGGDVISYGLSASPSQTESSV